MIHGCLKPFKSKNCIHSQARCLFAPLGTAAAAVLHTIKTLLLAKSPCIHINPRTNPFRVGDEHRF